MKIFVLGAGAVGGYYGGRLAEAGADVTFLVRPGRHEQLQRDGLVIESPAYGDARIRVRSVTAVDPAERYDVVVLTAKAYDLDSAIDAIRPAVGEHTAILPLLNGYAHIDRLVREFGEARVLGGVARIQATLTPAGVIKHLSDWRYIYFGELDGRVSPRVTALKALFDTSSVVATVSENIRYDLWTKLVHLATVAGMTCLMRGSVGEIARTPDGVRVMQAFFDLNVQIATRAGCAPKPAFIEEFRALFANRDAPYSASMARDIERGGPIEADHILGFMLERCREYGLDDLMHTIAYTHCKTYEVRRAANRLPGLSMPYDPIVSAGPGIGLAHPASYWAATAGPIPPDDGPAPPVVETEVAVIGGGYTGLATAWHLAHRYGRQVTVLEANRPAWGCSGRNGGFARMAFGRLSFGDMVARFGREPAKRLFGRTMASLDNVREMIREGAIDCDASEAGHLKVAPKASRAGALEAEARLMQRELEYPAEYLDAETLQRDHLGGAQSFGALRIPDALAVHPLKLSLGVLRMARAAGAVVHSSSPVTGWRKVGATHRLSTPQGEVHAKEVVIGTNGYTATGLYPELRATLFPILSHIIVTAPMTDAQIAGSGFVTGHVLTDARKLMFYWRRLPDRRILFGGRGLIADTPGGTADHRQYLYRELIAKYPALEGIAIEHDWHGWVCFTRDFLPRIRRAADDPTVHYGVGYQGSGVSLSLYAGRLLAAQIAGDGDEALAPIEPAALPIERFPAHRLLRIPQRALFHWYRFLDSRD